ncbi:hypothetical protein Tco_0281390 [Tanacetum coccineum]
MWAGVVVFAEILEGHWALSPLCCYVELVADPVKVERVLCEMVRGRLFVPFGDVARSTCGELDVVEVEEAALADMSWGWVADHSISDSWLGRGRGEL